MFKPVLFTLFCFASGALSTLLGPCKKQDSDCLTKSINTVTSTVYAGMPALMIPSSDPVFLKSAEINIPNLEAKFRDTQLRGFKDCVVHDADLNLETKKFNYLLDCPSFTLSGKYVVYGKLIGYPVEGDGQFDVVTGRYLLPVSTNIKFINKNDGKTYVNLADYTLKPEVKEPIKFYFRNLYNGRQHLSNSFHEFTHEHWKEVSDFIAAPIFKPFFDAVITNFNKFLTTEPLEEIFVDFLKI